MMDHVVIDPRGGGSGGGGNKSDSVVGVYVMTANRIEYIARLPTAADPTDDTTAVATSITMLATGEGKLGTGDGGLIELRGNQGVRVTAGSPMPLVNLPTSSPATKGIEIISAPLTTVTIAQGVGSLIPPPDKRSITLSDTDITIDGGKIGKITLQQGVPPADTSVTMNLSGVTITSGTAIALTATAGIALKSKTDIALTATTGIAMKSTADIALKAVAGITLDAGPGSLTLLAAGGAVSITLSSAGIEINGGASVKIAGKMIELN